MNFAELVNAAELTQSEVANILNISAVSVSKRVNNPNSDVKVRELRLIENAIGRPLYVNNNVHLVHNSEQVEIPYYNNPKLETDIKTSAVTSLWFDREMVENIWIKTPANLRITTMLGDKMNSGEYPLKNGDILIMDISEQDVTKAGIYAFTTMNDSYMFINGVTRRYDGTYRFYFYNSSYPERILTEEDFKEHDIKIIGRIVKNLSLTV